MENISIAQLFLIGSAFFVYYDASKNKIGKIQGEKGFFNMSAGGWALAALWIWIIAFPVYFIKRAKLIQKAQDNPKEPSNRNLKLAILGALFTVVLILNLSQISGGSPLPYDNEQALLSSMEAINNEMQKMASKWAVDMQNKKGSPKDIKMLLEKSFSKAGYSYSGTLRKMASEGINPFSGQVAAAYTVLLPLETGAMPEDVYSGQELEDVIAIRKMLRGK